MSVDLESFFHGHPMYADLGSDRRNEEDAGLTLRTTREILDIFACYNVSATFFVVSEIFKWHPQLIEEIRQAGHEIAFHTHDHTMIESPGHLVSQLRQAELFIQTYRPRGFRAPFCKLTQHCCSTLKNHGFHYDSSMYAWGQAVVIENDLLEIPITLLPYRPRYMGSFFTFPSSLTIDRLCQGFPLGSGLSWGVPFISMVRLIEKAMRCGVSPVLSFHPWQLNRPRHVYYLSSTFLIKKPWWYPYARPITEKLKEVIKEFNFSSIAQTLKRQE
jgi:hypothetical protein